MNRRTFIAALVVPIALLAGCQTGQKSDRANMGAVNAKCPMRPDCPVGEKAVTTDYKGRKVAFCCAGCIRGWDALTDAQRAERLEAVR